MQAKIFSIRHGVANYQNNKIDTGKKKYKATDFLEDFEQVKDLKENCLDDLKSYFQNFIRQKIFLLQEKNIRVWISPFARTIETGHVFLKQLQDLGIEAQSISFFETIGEVNNFSWDVFSKLVEGWELILGEEKIFLDKKQTNPQNLPITDYFFLSARQDISKKYLQEKWIGELVSKIETYSAITQRSQKVFNRAIKALSKKNLLFIFSHQAFTDWIIKKQEDYKNGGQNPGEILTIYQNLQYEREI